MDAVWPSKGPSLPFEMSARVLLTAFCRHKNGQMEGGKRASPPKGLMRTNNNLTSHFAGLSCQAIHPFLGFYEKK
jgi:hypothetical protein